MDASGQVIGDNYSCRSMTGLAWTDVRLGPSGPVAILHANWGGRARARSAAFDPSQAAKADAG